MSDSLDIIYCSRCGSEMKADSRYCMKCGNLNPDHPANKNMLKYIKNKQDNYQIGKGKMISEVYEAGNSTDVKTIVGLNTGNFTICFLLNFLTYMAIILGVSIYAYYFFDGNISGICMSGIHNIYIMVSIGYLWLFGNELVFMKLNQKWWVSLIPIYNMMILSKAVFNNKWLGLITLIPFVGMIYYLVLIYQLAKAFKKNGVLMILFPVIMFIVIGYGGSSFKNVNYVSTDENGLEKEFRRKKLLLRILLFFAILGFGIFCYVNINEIRNKYNSTSRKIYLYYVSNIIMNKVKSKIPNNKYTCDSNNNIMYFYSEEADEHYFIPLSVFNKPVHAMVRVEVKEGGFDYYLSVSDGEYGFDYTSFDKVNMDIIDEYSSVYDPGGTKCKYSKLLDN